MVKESRRQEAETLAAIARSTVRYERGGRGTRKASTGRR